MNTIDAARRLALGTAQFGLVYGVANTRGRVPLEDVECILSRARDAGIVTLDTAVAYGDSERVLGHFSLDGFEVISKLPAYDGPSDAVADWAHWEVEASLERLGIGRLDALLLHRPQQLLEDAGERLYGALCEMRHQGTVGRIGVSIYAPDELTALLGRYDMDLVQSPFNILDQRLKASGWLEHLRSKQVEAHARSVFLQGLLLMDDARRPAKFDRWQPLWRRWSTWLDETGQSPLQACLRFVLSEIQIQRVVVGVDTPAQLSEILAALDGDSPAPPASLLSEDAELLNPSMWSGL